MVLLERICRTIFARRVSLSESDKPTEASYFMKIRAALSIVALLSPVFVHAGDTDYYRHIIFDNSLTPDNYFYSYGQASGGSSIETQKE